MMYIQEKTLFIYAGNEAHMQGHYFNWELTSTLYVDLFVGWQTLLKMHQLKIFYCDSRNTWVDCDYEIWSCDYTFSKAVISAWTFWVFILVTLTFDCIGATVGCTVQILFSICIAILKMKLNTLFIKNFFFLLVIVGSPWLKNIQVIKLRKFKLKKNEWQYHAVIRKVSNLNLASQ